MGHVLINYFVRPIKNKSSMGRETSYYYKSKQTFVKKTNLVCDVTHFRLLGYITSRTRFVFYGMKGVRDNY